MDIVLFQEEMKKKIKNLFKADEYHFEQVEIIIPEKQEHNERIELEQDAYYYLASAELDIPISVALYLSSEHNFISTSKTDWEFDNLYNLEAFRKYLYVKTKNSLTPFEFKLKFLKVTPYRL